MGVFLCPGQTGAALNVSSNWNFYAGQVDPLWWWLGGANKSYGYNAHGAGRAESGSLGLDGMGNDGAHPLLSSQFSSQPESRILCPGDMVALADYDQFADDDGDGDHPFDLYALTLADKRHRGGANGVFCDAHVEFGNTNRWGAPAFFMPSGGALNPAALGVDCPAAEHGEAGLSGVAAGAPQAKHRRGAGRAGPAAAMTISLTDPLRPINETRYGHGPGAPLLGARLRAQRNPSRAEAPAGGITLLAKGRAGVYPGGNSCFGIENLRRWSGRNWSGSNWNAGGGPSGG